MALVGEVQRTAGSTPVAGDPIAFPGNVTAGNTILVAVVQLGSNGGQPASITDNRGNTYTRRTYSKFTNEDDFGVSIWSAPVGSSGPCTITVPGGILNYNLEGMNFDTSQYVGAIEVEGSAVFEQAYKSWDENTGTGIGGWEDGVDPVAGPTASLTTTDNICLAVLLPMIYGGGDTEVTTPSGWEEIALNPDALGIGVSVIAQRTNSTTSPTVTWSYVPHGPGTGTFWLSAMANFRVPAASSGTTHEVEASPTALGAPVAGNPAVTLTKIVAAAATVLGAPTAASPAATRVAVATATPATLGEIFAPGPTGTKISVPIANEAVLGAPTAAAAQASLILDIEATEALLGEPVAGSPGLTKLIGAVASTTVLGVPVAGQPAASLTLAFVANEAELGSPTADSPAVATGDELVADPALLGEPAAGSPAATVVRLVVASTTVLGAPVAGSPGVWLRWGLEANEALLGAPVAGMPALNLGEPIVSQAGGIVTALPNREIAFALPNRQIVSPASNRGVGGGRYGA